MASREEEKKRLREEREAAEAARQAKQATSRKLTYAAGAVLGALAIVLVVVLVVSGGGNKSKKGSSGDWANTSVPADALSVTKGNQKALLQAAAAANCKFNTNANEGATHQADDYNFKYKANPPTSGDHVVTPTADGAYRETTSTTPNLVHGLEHGRTEFLWTDKTPATFIGGLKKLYDDAPYHLILHPSTSNMPFAAAATAWDHSLTCTSVSDKTYKALRLFQVTWTDRAPEKIP